MDQDIGLEVQRMCSVIEKNAVAKIQSEKVKFEKKKLKI